MTLVVLGKEDLDELALMVIPRFASVLNKNLARRRFSHPLKEGAGCAPEGPALPASHLCYSRPDSAQEVA